MRFTINWDPLAPPRPSAVATHVNPSESLLEDAEDTVSVVVAASAEKVWQMISDVGRMGAWGQETSSAEWVGGANGPAVGARFRSHGKGWPQSFDHRRG